MGYKFKKTSKLPNKLLILDNAPCHSTTGLTLTKFELLFLSLHTTSKIQPLETEIILSFKRRYKKHLIKKVI